MHFTFSLTTLIAFQKQQEQVRENLGNIYIKSNDNGPKIDPCDIPHNIFPGPYCVLALTGFEQKH